MHPYTKSADDIWRALHCISRFILWSQALILIYWPVMYRLLTLEAHQGRFLINFRLLHSPSLVATGLTVGYDAWHPIGWHHAFVIGWSKYRLRLPSAPLHYGLTWPMGIPPFFRPQWQYLPLGLCKGLWKSLDKFAFQWRLPVTERGSCLFEERRVEWKADDVVIIRVQHWSRNQMAAISQTTFSNAFFWMKMYEFGLRFHWSLFLVVQLTILQHWFR